VGGVGEVLAKLIHAFIENVGLAALLISSGLLILLSNRDLFEVDPKPREERDPAGPTRRVWMWKYMSDFAERGRLELLHLTRILRVAATTMLVLAVLMFLIAGFVGVLEWFGLQDLANWFKNNSSLNFVFDHGLGIVLLIFGPFLIYRFARVVSNVIRARDVPGANKPPGWTAFN
jgi:hypothetical protein